MKRILFFSLLFLLVANASGQVQHIDSLVKVVETKKLSSEEQLKIYEEISQFYSRYDLEKGFKYANRGLQLAEKEKDKKKISSFNKLLGVIYYNKSSLDTSQVYLEKALAFALDAKDGPSQMAAYGSLGNVYRLKQDYQKALNYYMKTLSLHDVPIDPAHVSTLNNVAVIHRILNNPSRAIYYFSQALEQAEQLNLDEQKMSAVYGLGTVYADMEDNTTSEEYFQKALEISQELGNKPYEIISINSLATCFNINKDFNTALAYAQKGLEVAEEYGDPRHILGAYGTLADIFREMERFKECEEIALKSWVMDSTSVEDASYTAYTLTIANIYLGQKERAEYFLNKYYEIMKTGNDRSLHNSLADMEIKYETEKKEMRIVSLEKEKLLYVWLGIVGVLFTFSLAIVLWLKIKNARREKHLIATRSVLDGEMGERTRLARDLHDRLSGNLSALKIGLNNNKESLQSIHDKLDSCIEEIRRVAHNLMPASLQFGLKAALEDFAFQFSNVRFHFFGEECRIEERKAFIIYCCGVELVNNSLRHSNAQKIDIQLIQSEKYVSLTVQDDGCGFDEKSIIKGLGLKNIYDRVTSCNGNIDTVTSPGKGVETTIQLKTGDL